MFPKKNLLWPANHGNQLRDRTRKAKTVITLQSLLCTHTIGRQQTARSGPRRIRSSLQLRARLLAAHLCCSWMQTTPATVTPSSPDNKCKYQNHLTHYLSGSGLSDLPLPLPSLMEWGSGLWSKLQPQAQKTHREEQHLTHWILLSRPQGPSASDGQHQIDGNHTLSLGIFMHTSNLNFQVHMTISKSDIQCSQTVHL